jgi:hypothetical protein
MEKVNLHERCKEIYNLTLQFLTEYCGKKAKKKKKKNKIKKKKKTNQQKKKKKKKTNKF